MIRATCVTDRTVPVVTVTTQLRREEYNALNEIARKRKTTKAEIIRGMIQDLLRREE